MNKRKPLVLGAYLAYGTGHHPAAWRSADVPADGAQNIDHYIRLAQEAERGLFDFMFLSDTPSVFLDDRAGYGARVAVFEPLTLLSAIAMHTTDLGLVATASTTYKPPFDLAREFASLDWISKGRAAWNLVTSSKANAAHNYGLDHHPEHAERYVKANEAYQVITGLWDSWEDDALIRDKRSGKFYRPEGCHPLNHQGHFFKVAGPLNVARPPQGYPVIVQAGSSEDGMTLAARTAEVVFTAQNDLGTAKDFYQNLKGRLGNFPRLNDDILIMPGFCPFSAPTEAQAKEKFEYFQSLITPEFGLSMLSDLLGGFDLSGCDLDMPLPKLPESNGNQSRRALIERLSENGKLSVKQLYKKIVVSRGHFNAVGSYRQIAELMAEWYYARGCDGFNIMPPSMPGCLQDFVDGVVPELQRLGIYKTQYQAGTLRQKLGLKRPSTPTQATKTIV